MITGYFQQLLAYLLIPTSDAKYVRSRARLRASLGPLNSENAKSAVCKALESGEETTSCGGGLKAAASFAALVASRTPFSVSLVSYLSGSIFEQLEPE